MIIVTCTFITTFKIMLSRLSFLLKQKLLKNHSTLTSNICKKIYDTTAINTPVLVVTIHQY